MPPYDYWQVDAVRFNLSFIRGLRVLGDVENRD